MGRHEERRAPGALAARATSSSRWTATSRHQQSVSALSFGIVVIGAASNRTVDLLPVVPGLLQAIDAVQPGEVRRVGTSPKGRGRSG